MDLLSELDQLTKEKEDTESDDWLPDGRLEDSGSTVQKRFLGYGGKRRAQRKRFLGTKTVKPDKRLFCNFGGCFNGKRSVPSEPRLLVSNCKYF